MRILILLFTLLLFTQCKKQHPQPTGVVSKNAMVVSARKEASKIGIAILQKGGNADCHDRSSPCLWNEIEIF